MSVNIPPDVAVRAATSFEVIGDCYVSTYSIASHGYAQIGWFDRVKMRGTTAHRAAWAWVNGQIPAGMTIDHTCKNRPCVRLSHLRMLSNYENARRTFGRDWPLGECIRGHSNDFLERHGKHLRCSLCKKPPKPRIPKPEKPKSYATKISKPRKFWWEET